MDWLQNLRKDKTLYAGLLDWIKKLDAEAIQRYDAVKSYEDFLEARGARKKIQEIFLRLTKED